jgi:hypothetical protein
MSELPSAMAAREMARREALERVYRLPEPGSSFLIQEAKASLSSAFALRDLLQAIQSASR